MTQLRDVTRYVRSKNAGPFWVTFDVFFASDELFARHCEAPALQAPSLAALYEVTPQEVRRFPIPSLNALKISIPRQQPQGGVLERDMHSGQQYVSMLTLDVGP